ncbi:MAG: GNAT family N-acetyltransferase [Pseudomonadota bacterium]|nr:GNAT family N-acetyltransferase [Pseudomonadota bacterium]
MLRPDAWLSQQLGKAAWHLALPEDPEADIALPVPGPCFVDAKVAVADTAGAARLEAAGFRLVDTNVQLQRPAWPGAHSRTSRMAEDRDRRAVEAIAGSSFQTSRFHLDPAIPGTVADRVKRAWAGNYFEGRRGDLMIVAEVEREVAGFLQLLRQGETLVIDLIAVDAHFRGHGLAHDMIACAEATVPDIKVLRVGTQIANPGALRTYLRNRFEVVQASYVFHYHG